LYKKETPPRGKKKGSSAKKAGGREEKRTRKSKPTERGGGKVDNYEAGPTGLGFKERNRSKKKKGKRRGKVIGLKKTRQVHEKKTDKIVSSAVRP